MEGLREKRTVTLLFIDRFERYPMMDGCVVLGGPPDQPIFTQCWGGAFHTSAFVSKNKKFLLLRSTANTLFDFRNKMAGLKASPVKMSNVSFSFADTSFEKVYAKLQKEVKFLESLNQDESHCSYNSTGISPGKSGITERLIYVNPDQKTFRIGSLYLSNEGFTSPTKQSKTQVCRKLSKLVDNWAPNTLISFSGVGALPINTYSPRRILF